MIDRDDVLLIDVEATCWANNEKPADQESEIIEIGLTPVNLRSLEIGPSVALFVQPDHSEVTEFCTNLTTITQARLDEEGIPFSEACARLRMEFLSRERTWISWGNYDREIFFKDCVRKGVEYPFSEDHINLKTLFGILRGHRKGPGVKRGLGRLNMEFEGTHHRGVDDSYNIARIFVELLKKGR